MSTSTPSNNEFGRFPLLPTEIRLKIWAQAQDDVPPRLIPFYVRKADLDFLRYRRPACHNYAHIYAAKMDHVPVLLHACRESREVALRHYYLNFDISRLMSMGQGDLDVDAYTTCSHEVAKDELGCGVYWDQRKDVVFLDVDEQRPGGWDHIHSAAFVWGGKMGVRLGRMPTLGLTYAAVLAIGSNECLRWESIDTLLVVLRGLRGRDFVNASSNMQMMVASGKIFSSESDRIPDLRFDFKNVEDLVEYVKGMDR